jgi:hypothetical protein
MSNPISIYEIPTKERLAFAEKLTPAQLQEAFQDVAILNAELTGDSALLTLAEDLGTFAEILEAPDLETAKKLATEALVDLIPAVIERVNAADVKQEVI